jgi:hypothetical protein
MSSLTHPAPEGASLCSRYQVTVDGVPAPVYDARIDPPHDVAYVSFDVTGKARVVVTVPDGFRSVIVRPKHAGVLPRIDGNTIALDLGGPVKLSVELDGGTDMPLLVFANPAEQDAPSPGDPHVRYFSPGIHRPGEMRLESDETVYVAAGAIVHGWFVADGARRVRILGRGILDAHENDTSLIRMTDCKDVVVEGITIADQPTFRWTTSYWSCEDVIVKNIKILAGDDVSNDGIDIVSCKRFTVDDCFVKCFDDCVAIKAIHTKRRPVDAITITRCLFWNIQAHGVVVGAELDTPEVSNIVGSDCDFIHASQIEDPRDRYYYYSGVVGIVNGDDAVVSNVRFERLRVEDGVGKLVNIKLMKTEWNPTDAYGQIRDIVFKDVEVVDGRRLPSEILSCDLGPKYAPNASRPNVPKRIRFEEVVILGEPVRCAEDMGLTVNPFCEELEIVSRTRAT